MITTSITPLVLTILLLSKASGEDSANPQGSAKHLQITETGEEHNLEKRHVSSLLGNRAPGQLPYQSGKRDSPTKSSLDELAERLEEAAQEDKRYLGALARSGDLRMVARDRQEKREDLDSLIDELATTEEMRRMQIDALRDDLFEEEPDKRGVVSLARAGYLKPTTHDFLEDDEESSFYPAEPDEDKRGGIASLARNGYYQKRTVDAELEQLMSEVYGIGEKRSVASLARSYNLPNSVKGNYENDDEKRNIPSLLRDRTSPLGEGKRHIGSFVANHGIPFVNNKDGGKRNVGSLARNRDFPYAVKFGKRDAPDEEGEEMSKRYVATLLRQGRLPIGIDSPDHGEMSAMKEDNSGHDVDKDEMSQVMQDDASKLSIRKKKSVPTTVEGPSRTKREAAAPMDEFGGARDDDSLAQFVDDAADSPINKRYFGVRGGGKMPGGRLPKVGGRSRNRHENSGRRRH